MLYHAGDSRHTQNIQIKCWKSFAPAWLCESLDVWVPHKLSEKNLLDHISACNSLLKHNENVPFLKQIVTGDEKWILYNNVEWKRSWGKENEPPPTTPKSGLHPKKTMLCIWWNWKGVLYYEFLLEKQQVLLPVRPNESSTQRKRLELVNRKWVIFHEDTARLHVPLITRQKLLQLGWEVLIHRPYSPDIVPSDFHLFCSLQNSLNGRNFHSLEDSKRHLQQFFAQKDKKFWEDGIMKLPEKWQKVVEQKGKYIIQWSSWWKWKICLLFLLKNQRNFWPTQ